MVHGVSTRSVLLHHALSVPSLPPHLIDHPFTKLSSATCPIYFFQESDWQIPPGPRSRAAPNKQNCQCGYSRLYKHTLWGTRTNDSLMSVQVFCHKPISEQVLQLNALWKSFLIWVFGFQNYRYSTVDLLAFWHSKHWEQLASSDSWLSNQASGARNF
jgi:hypothetical protein